MKMKFHLGKRNPSRHGLQSAAQNMQAVAFVDERYLKWLAEEHTTAPVQLQRQNLLPILAEVLRHHGTEWTLARVYLFSDQQVLELCDDMVVRSVPPDTVDGGLGLVRALGSELNLLSQHGGMGLAMVVSDDERLIPYIDEAQWRGTKIAVVTDDSGLDMPKLMKDAPASARLLLQADRRLAFGHNAWEALTVPGLVVSAPPALSGVPSAHSMGERELEPVADNGYFNQAAPSESWMEQVRQVIQTWWTEETTDARLDLYEEMQNSQGVPPETDRHLLLRVRRELQRTLSFQEKKAMRELIRNTVLAQAPDTQEEANAVL